MKGIRSWYHLQWARKESSFEQEKIIYPFKSKENRFALDKDNSYFSADVYFFTIKEEFKSLISYPYLLTILNSKVYQTYMQAFLKKMGNSIYEYYPYRLLETYIFLDENYKTNEIFQWALKEVSIQFPLQVYEDGMLWEQSTMYHVEVLSYGLNLLQQAKFFDIELSNDIEESIKRLSTSLLLQITPQHTIEAYGDSDEVYALDILQRCAIILEDDKYLSLCNQELFESENLYYLQDEGAKKYLMMSKVNMSE